MLVIGTKRKYRVKKKINHEIHEYMFNIYGFLYPF